MNYLRIHVYDKRPFRTVSPYACLAAHIYSPTKPHTKVATTDKDSCEGWPGGRGSSGQMYKDERCGLELRPERDEAGTDNLILYPTNKYRQ